MSRITNANLQEKLNVLNSLAGQAKEPITMTDEGPQENIGNYHLDHQHNGYQLVQLMTNGGTREISQGFMPKREIYSFLTAVIIGIQIGKENQA